MSEDLEDNSKNNNEIIIKSINDEILFIIPENEAWNKIISQLTSKLEIDKNFWIGANISVELGNRKLEEIEIVRLHDLLIKRYFSILNTIYSVDEETRSFAEKNNIKASKVNPLSKITNTIPKVSEILEDSILGNALYLKQSIRTGQVVKFDGNIIIFGNVNPAAEIIASGDIIILGVLNGNVHAGAKGNDNAQIIASSLGFKAQLRISRHICTTSNDDKLPPHIPKCFKLKDENIYLSLLEPKINNY